MPAILSTVIFAAATLADTIRLAQKLAPLGLAGDVIALSGGLGSGKTEFARAFIRARAGRSIEAPSPTFTLVQIYELSDLDIWHVDLYRIEHEDEIVELGLEEALTGAISLIEWPERLGRMLPRSRLDIAVEIGAGDMRRFTLTGSPDWAERLVKLEERLQTP
jgi:tRNA threonylcarbamoyladenosine biosynthesis protein TsaE